MIRVRRHPCHPEPAKGLRDTQCIDRTEIPRKLGMTVLVCVLCATSLAQDVPVAKRPATIDAAIEQLNDPVYVLRESASQYLWEAGHQAEPALQGALKSKHYEVVHRCRAILQKFQWGIYPDTPDEVVRLIKQYQDSGGHVRRAIVTKLMTHESAGIRALLKIGKLEQDQLTKQSIYDGLRRQAIAVAPVLLVDGKETEARELIEGAANSGDDAAIRHYAAYLALRGQLVDKIAELKAKNRSRIEMKMLAYLQRANGELKQAAVAAQQSLDIQLHKSILFELGDWRTLAKLDGIHVAQQIENGAPINNIESVGFAAAYLRLSQENNWFNLIVDEVVDSDRAPVGNLGEVLMLNDRFDEAVSMYVKNNQHTNAFKILIGRSMYDDAFALAKRAKDQGAASLFELDLTVARAWHGLDEIDNSRRILDALGELDTDWNNPTPLVSLIRTCTDVGYHEKSLELAAHALGHMTAETQESQVLGAVYPNKSEQAGTWWWFYRRRHEGEARLATLRRVDVVLRGEMPMDEFRGVVGQLATEAGKLPNTTRARWLSAAAETWLERGSAEQATHYMVRAVELAPTSANLKRLGEVLMDQKRFDDAAETFDRAWRLQRSDPSLLLLKGHALVLGGKVDEGQELMELSKVLPLGDDRKRFSIASSLEKIGMKSEADQQRSLIARTADFDSWYLGNTLSRMVWINAYEKKEFTDCVRVGERYRLACLRTNTSLVEVEHHLYLAMRIHDPATHAALAAEDYEQAFEHAIKCVKIRPAAIDVVIDVVTALDKAGRKQQADQLFEAAWNNATSICRKYSNSSAHHNRASWLAAKCKRRLNEALGLSQRAVQLKPKHAAFLDTLAEVNFHLGHRDKAIELAKKCIELDPDEAFFKEQLKRFSE